MGIYREIRNYLNDTNFKLTLTNNYLNIENYTKIIALSENEIKILLTKQILEVSGQNLKLKRLMNAELVVIGFISSLKLVACE